MKILFASLPADGHFNPLTGLAVHLARQGHDVRWYAGPAYGARVDRLGLPWFAYRRATEVMAGHLDDLFPERRRLKGPQLISFDMDKLFVGQVENHFWTSGRSRRSGPSTCLSATGRSMPNNSWHPSSTFPSSPWRCRW